MATASAPARRVRPSDPL